jgi:RNA polymerase sigma-70 factor (ECF subfamily)
MRHADSPVHPGDAALFRLLCLALAVPAGPEGAGLREALWRHHHYLLALLRCRCGDSDLADDLLQETYLAILRAPRLPDFPDDRHLRNYLVGAALNKLRDHFRGRDAPSRRLAFRNTQDLEDWIDGLPDPAADHAAAFHRREDDQERLDLVALALESLPERWAEILRHKFIGNLDNPTIAAKLGLGVKAVESLLHRAKAGFKAEFERLSLSADGSAAGDVDPKGKGRAR